MEAVSFSNIAIVSCGTLSPELNFAEGCTRAAGDRTNEVDNRRSGTCPAVNSIHHQHLWGLTPQHLMLTIHVALAQTDMAGTPVISEIKRVLRKEYGIKHSTIEVEAQQCADD